MTSACAPQALPSGLSLGVHTQVLAVWQCSFVDLLDLIPCDLGDVPDLEDMAVFPHSGQFCEEVDICPIISGLEEVHILGRYLKVRVWGASLAALLVDLQQ